MRSKFFDIDRNQDVFGKINYTSLSLHCKETRFLHQSTLVFIRWWIKGHSAYVTALGCFNAFALVSHRYYHMTEKDKGRNNLKKTRNRGGKWRRFASNTSFFLCKTLDRVWLCQTRERNINLITPMVVGRLIWSHPRDPFFNPPVVLVWT